MTRSKGDMTSPRYLLALTAALNFLVFSHGGPLGPLPNVTSADVGLIEGTCALGDVVYMSGDEFPGATPCDRCTCGRDGVQCIQLQCEPRPGCKALHRPDHCCPTYQCECEQEGRVYGNGEKLVDPQDPCRVCYCQGGEVVCRRIACFVRNDCTPRLVPGRCCPEYDNCPLRGVTSLPSITPVPSISSLKPVETAPSPPKDEGPRITIKEITPVSEIPVITDVKIKEIPSSPSVEVAEYSSSKSPLITREATSENNLNADLTKPEPEASSVVEVHSTETTSSESKPTDVSKGVDDVTPSKISLSREDYINSEIYSSNVPIVATMGVPSIIVNSPVPVATTTKPLVIDEEDPSLFVDHNPAFPPLPDDLSVLSNHGDELVPEPSADTDHIPIDHAPTPEVIIASVTPSSEAESKELLTTTPKSHYLESSITTTEKIAESTTELNTTKLEATSTTELPSTTEALVVKENPTVKLRSAIPTETLTVSSEETRTSQETIASTTVAQEPLSTATTTTTAATTVTSTTAATSSATSTTTEANEFYSTASSTTSSIELLSSTTNVIITDGSKSIEDMSIEVPAKPKNFEEITTDLPKISKKLESLSEEPISKTSEEYTTDEPEVLVEKVRFFTTSSSPEADSTVRPTEAPTTKKVSTTSQEQITDSIAKSNVATEVTSQTELSSLPIETSDQNPHEASENVSKETLKESNLESFTTTDKFLPPSSEVITVSKTYGNGPIENVETTEFIVNSYGSSESATDAVELIKIAGDSDKNAAVIESTDSNKNALTDLIKLVSDVASISDHTDAPVTLNPFASTTIADSEELILVNAGYKSKNSNFNQNSITEVPSFKSKSGTPATKQKIVEIEDDEDGNITDSPPPDDKVEPTTRRPIIDNVSDDIPDMKTEKNDIEIIRSQSYVPTINRRPTKVVQEATPAVTTEGSIDAVTVAPQ